MTISNPNGRELRAKFGLRPRLAAFFALNKISLLGYRYHLNLMRRHSAKLLAPQTRAEISKTTPKLLKPNSALPLKLLSHVQIAQPMPTCYNPLFGHRLRMQTRINQSARPKPIPKRKKRPKNKGWMAWFLSGF